VLAEALEQKQAERAQQEQQTGGEAVENSDGQNEIENTDSAEESQTTAADAAVSNDDTLTANDMDSTQNSVSCEAAVYPCLFDNETMIDCFYRRYNVLAFLSCMSLAIVIC